MHSDFLGANPRPDEADSGAAGEPEEETYEEALWQRAMSAREMTAEEWASFEISLGDTDASGEGGLPELDELLKQIPASSQELIDSLFRGRFIGVRRLNRKKLF